MLNSNGPPWGPQLERGLRVLPAAEAVLRVVPIGLVMMVNGKVLAEVEAGVEDVGEVAERVKLLLAIRRPNRVDAIRVNPDGQRIFYGPQEGNLFLLQ